MSRKIAEVRRPEIIQALSVAITQDGIRLPGYDAIAKQGGISRQLLRHYYANSEAMAVDLSDTLAAVYRDLLAQNIIAAEDSKRLDIFLDFYFDMLENQALSKPKDDALYDALFAFANTSEQLRDQLHEQYSLLQMTLAHEIQISHTQLSQEACQELGYMIVAMMYGHWKMVATLGFSTDYKKTARGALDRLINSYLAEYKA